MALLAVLFGSTLVYDSKAESTIPDWIKNLTKSWSEDKISNEEFAQGINHLVKNKMLSIPEMESLVNENQQLKDEMNSLKSQLLEYETMMKSQKLMITVHTNKELYGPEDDIVIFGTVSSLVEEHDVGIVISESSGKILAIAKISPSNDKSYGFVAKGPIFRQSGDYSVHVYYGGQAYSHTEYAYRPMMTQS